MAHLVHRGNHHISAIRISINAGAVMEDKASGYLQIVRLYCINLTADTLSEGSVNVI